ncbi:unnamed protein product [Musa acuminata subsp. malaccensis]|uniref:(wild Malaysian banana) hypothetical protein n=1 Tax=Musa acuminata subsp. malaccensis TaxID=214687 RepID=A0A804JFT2_MUSAM|nr:unnamed protein product [Musa acuminata subsp. malaccensis]
MLVLFPDTLLRTYKGSLLLSVWFFDTKTRHWLKKKPVSNFVWMLVAWQACLQIEGCFDALNSRYVLGSDSSKAGSLKYRDLVALRRRQSRRLQPGRTLWFGTSLVPIL